MIRTEPAMAYDFALMLQQLLESGLTPDDIRIGALTDRMLHHYRKGVQPLHWRGERIITFWCETFRRPREDAPVTQVVRGHRVDRRMTPGPRVQALPQWPPAAQPAVKMRKKPGPKPKVRVAA